MSTIILARGYVTKADELTVELIEPATAPPAVLLRWPAQPSVTEPIRFPATANAIMSILAAAVARLSEIRSAQL